MTTRRWVIVAGAVVFALAAAFVMSRGTPRHDGPSASGEPSAPPRLVRVEASEPDPAGEGPTVGSAQSENGARMAAMAYASAPQRWMYLDDAGVASAVDAIATTAAAPRLTADVLDEVRVAREGLTAAAGPVWWLVRPLATNVVTQRDGYARVSVWVVTILSAADVAMPQSEWRTITLELRWERGDWRVDGITDVAGPTPMVGPRDRPWAPEPFADALAGFVRVGESAP